MDFENDLPPGVRCSVQLKSGLYIPQNYDHQFKGWVSARTALGASLNVPAVRTLVMVSPDAFFKQLHALGMPLKESGGYYGYSLALGSSEVSLLSLTNAYRSLSNGGQFSATSLVKHLKPAFKPALDERAAFIVPDIMADPLARARTFGTDSVLATHFWTAVKTGTSKDMRDNWAIGFSQHYTVGVWVGNASGAPMWDVSGTSGAAPIWAALMNHLHSTQKSRAPAPPAGLVKSPVKFGDGLEAARDEWFIQGTEQAVIAMNSEASYARSAGEVATKSLKNDANLTVPGCARRRRVRRSRALQFNHSIHEPRNLTTERRRSRPIKRAATPAPQPGEANLPNRLQSSLCTAGRCGADHRCHLGTGAVVERATQGIAMADQSVFPARDGCCPLCPA